MSRKEIMQILGIAALLLVAMAYFNATDPEKLKASEESRLAKKQTRAEEQQAILIQDARRRLENGVLDGSAQYVMRVTDEGVQEELRNGFVDALNVRLAETSPKNHEARRDIFSELSLLGDQSSYVQKSHAFYQEMYAPNLWRSGSFTNPVDDTETVTVQLDAHSGSADRFGQKMPLLNLRCKSNKTELYVDWHSFLGWEIDGDVNRNEKQVLVRVGEKKAYRERWQNSTDDKALFAPRAIALARQIAENDRLIVQVVPHGDNPVTTIFNTRGAWTSIKKVANHCNWSLREPQAPKP